MQSGSWSLLKVLRSASIGGLTFGRVSPQFFAQGPLAACNARTLAGPAGIRHVHRPMGDLRHLLAGLVLALGLACSARADVVTRLPTADRVVALTFDACMAHEPASFDRQLLEYLVSRRIPFTLFVTGRFIEHNRADMERLAGLDFVDIENHSFDHPNGMNRFRPDDVLRQVSRAEEVITDLTGRPSQFFRFPAGNFNARGLAAVEAQGLHVVHWRWATGDPSRSETADRLHERVLRQTEPGDILIFHINGRGWHTAEALPRIVEDLQAQGYRFVLVSDYLGQPRRQPHAIDKTAAAARRMIEALALRAAAAGPLGAFR